MADYPLINTGKTTAVIDSALGELNDVDVQSASDDQVLTFVSGASPSARWQPSTVKRDNWMHANTGLDFTTPPTSTGLDGIAIGRDTHSSGYKSLAIGDNALSSGTDAAAVGYKAKANGNYSLALGTTATATAHNSIAIGGGFDTTSSTADSSIAIGRGATADNVDSKIILLTDNAGIRVKPNGNVETTSDGGVSWSTISTSVNFPPQQNVGDRFDKDTDVGAIVYFDGTAWKKSKADDPFTLGSAVIDWVGDNGSYTIKNSGVVNDVKSEINGGSPLLPGYYYYLSKTDAGQITKDEPDETGDFVVPVYQALSETSALIIPFRANLLGDTIPTVQVANHKMLFRKMDISQTNYPADYFKITYANGTWVAHVDKKIHRSEGIGNSWEEINLNVTPQTVQTYDIDTNGANKWISVQDHDNGHILVSEDDAKTWESVRVSNKRLEFMKIVCDRIFNDVATWIMYGSGSNEYLISNDDGVTWESKQGANFDNIISNGNGNWVASTRNEIYFSEDNGDSFNKVFTTSVGSLPRFSGSKLASNRKGRVICAVQGNQVYKSNDWGKTWFDVSAYGFKVDKFEGNVYLLVTDAEGIWYASGASSDKSDSSASAVSIDDGATWYPGPAGLNISELADQSASSGDFGNDVFIVGRSPNHCSRTLLP